MQNHLKFLVVEDREDWSTGIGAIVNDFFQNRGLPSERIKGFSAFTANQADPLVSQGGWDLVMLDMNLGKGAGKDRVSGLDLLGEIAEGNKAFFVIIVTGSSNDPTLEKVYGPETAARIRFGALNEAVMELSGRFGYVPKPDSRAAGTSLVEIRPHLEAALEQYCTASIERNIFRRSPDDPKVWQIRFNGGRRVAVAYKEHYRVYQSALAQPLREISIVPLIEKIAHSSGAGPVIIEESYAQPPRGRHADPKNNDVDWSDKRGMSQHKPSRKQWDIEPEVVIRALSSPEANTIGITKMVWELVKHYSTQGAAKDMLGMIAHLPKAIDEILDRGVNLAAEFPQFGADAAAELRQLKSEIKRILPEVLAELRSIGDRKVTRSQAEGKPSSRKPTFGRGKDSNPAATARKHGQRFEEEIRDNTIVELEEFYTHMSNWIVRGDRLPGKICYRPPSGDDFFPYWLTV